MNNLGDQYSEANRAIKAKIRKITARVGLVAGVLLIIFSLTLAVKLSAIAATTILSYTIIALILIVAVTFLIDALNNM